MQFVNEISINYKKRKLDFPKVDTSYRAYDCARKIYQQQKANMEVKEFFFLLLLDRGNNVLGYYKVSEGGITGTVVDVRLVFSTVLKTLATGVVLIHNHPSGNIWPSKNDIDLTRKIKKAGEILDITVCDHIIVTPERYYSFADNGEL